MVVWFGAFRTLSFSRKVSVKSGQLHKATEVDAFLRHVTAGQAFQSSIAHQHSMATWHRTALAVDRIARQCFGQVVAGLSRE